MATLTRSYPSNAPGPFFVDDTCIDCDMCRQIAPSIYAEEGDHSVVQRQPRDEAETLRAGMALIACPTGSIGTRSKVDLRSAMDAFPELIENNGSNVYFCGYASPQSFGAASYLVVRPEGNVLIDSPRFASNLVRRIEALGGVSAMFLTHRDDVADHEKFHKHFGCRRIIHEADSGGMKAEVELRGNEAVEFEPGFVAVPVPGHTRGHAVAYYGEKYLFTGDHLAWSERRGALIAFRGATWYSWREQTLSMERLVGRRFEWVLPGHGRRVRLPAAVAQDKLRECVEWMRNTP